MWEITCEVGLTLGVGIGFFRRGAGRMLLLMLPFVLIRISKFPKLVPLEFFKGAFPDLYTDEFLKEIGKKIDDYMHSQRWR